MSILKNVPLETFDPSQIVMNLDSIKNQKNRLGKFVKLSYRTEDNGATIPFNIEFDNCYLIRFHSEYNTEDSIRLKISETQAQKLDEIQLAISEKAMQIIQSGKETDDNILKTLKIIANDMKNKANKGEVIFINMKNVSKYFRAIDVEGNSYELDDMFGSMNELEIFGTAVVNICPFVSNQNVGSFSRSLQRVLIKEQRTKQTGNFSPTKWFNCLN